MRKALAINELAMKPDSEKKLGFPIEVFPNEIQHIIKEYQQKQSFATEFTSAGILTAVAGVVGNSLSLEVERGFKVPIHLFYITVQERGTRKTAPLNAMLRPIIKKDMENKEIYEAELKQYKAKLLAAKGEAVDEPEPTAKRIIYGKMTSESMFKFLPQNPQGIIQYINEARLWFGTFNQYSNNSDENLYCDIWDGYRASRSTLKHGNEDIIEPRDTIIGSIQPKEIADFIHKNTENGLTDRILFDYPDYLKEEKESREQLSEVIQQNWIRIINKVHNIYRERSIEFSVIKYTPDALNTWYDYRDNNVDKINEENDNIYRGIVRKAENSLHRLAQVLQVLKSISNGINEKIQSIDIECVKNAIILSDYYIDQAMKLRKTVATNAVPEKMDLWFATLPEKDFENSKAYSVGKGLGISQRSVDRYLTNHPKIERVSKGKYKKILE